MPLTASQRNIPLTSPQPTNDSGGGGAAYSSHPSSSGHASSMSGASKIGFDMMESARIYVSGLASRMWGSISVETLRPLPMFLGISGNNFCMSAEAFTPPVKKMDKTTPEKITSRVKLNISFFLTNYALVAFGVAVVVALMHPSMIFSLCIVWGLWWGHNYLISHEVVVVGRNIGSILSISHRFYVLFLLTVTVVIWKCLKPTMIFVTITGLIVAAHALMRDPKHIDKYSSTGIRRGSSDSDDEDDNNGTAVMVDHPHQKDNEV